MSRAETREATPEETERIKAKLRAKRAETREATPEEAERVKTLKPAEATEQPSPGRSAAEGALQGGSFGFGDEVQGVLGAALRRDPAASAMLGMPSPAEMGEENITGGNSFMEDYRAERNAARRDRKSAEEANPKAYNISQIAAAVLGPGPKPKGKGVGEFVKAGAKGGGLYGLGASDSDLTAGNVGGAAVDTALGTGVGGIAGLGAGALSKYLLQPLAGKASQMGAEAAAKGRAMAEKPIDAAINSASGKLGGSVSAGRNTLGNLAEDAVNSELPEDLSRRAGELLSDDAAKALNERVARATQGQFFQKLPAIERAQAGLDDALEGGSQEARDAAYQALMDKSPLKRALWEIAKRTAPTVAGSSIGGALGGTAGAGVGGALGLLTGAMSGRPGRIMTNALRSPQFQRSAAQASTRALEESIPGALEGVISEQSGNPQSSTREKLAPWTKFLDPDEETP